MSTVFAGPNVQTGPNLDTPLPIDLVWNGFIEPHELNPDELFHGVQSLCVPKDSLAMDENGGGVTVAAQLNGKEQRFKLPVGMVVTVESRSEQTDQTTETVNFVMPGGFLAPMSNWPTEDPPAPVAFREAVRIDTAEQVFFADQDLPVKVAPDPAAASIDMSWSYANATFETTNITQPTHSEHQFTLADSIELRKRLASDVAAIAGKTTVAALAESDFKEMIEAAEKPSLGSLLAEVVAERRLQDDPVYGMQPGVKMDDGRAKGYSSGANNNGDALPRRSVEAQPKALARLRAKLAAGAAALASLIPFPQERRGRHAGAGTHRMYALQRL